MMEASLEGLMLQKMGLGDGRRGTPHPPTLILGAPVERVLLGQLPETPTWKVWVEGQSCRALSSLWGGSFSTVTPRS